MQKNTSSMKDYIELKQIGKGSYGTVFTVKRKKDNQIFAMKVLKID